MWVWFAISSPPDFSQGTNSFLCLLLSLSRFLDRDFGFLWRFPLTTRSQTSVPRSPLPAPRSPFPVLVTSLNSAVVRSKMEVVLRCENYDQLDALPLLISQCFMWSRAGCYYRLVFHRWLLISEQFELTVINNVSFLFITLSRNNETIITNSAWHQQWNESQTT